ncbi:hypothetical protein K431DRAFT_333627 [Polychaeton citri CBS 116435]|uniref:Vps41 beta-propeller domain-containing protein n=1 Tax=Polychaeton citri CBS 116435 TaxID=1314669 RepID=A0A9P4Q4E0_9PEZI|nr:hypothetical protein K431DRAFT_333627 [Polychaeton citri CBS 116435]
MSAASLATEPSAVGKLEASKPHVTAGDGGNGNSRNEREEEDGGEESVEDEDADEDEDEEPHLKYKKLTSSLQGAYRNGDSTSAFWVGGDKMIMGTHNGSIHVFGMPAIDLTRSYKAHQATVTAIDVSPVPPPPIVFKTENGAYATLAPPPAPISKPQTFRSTPQPSATSPKAARQPQQVPNTPNNQIYIATSSLDGHVCVASLVDPSDVQLRNFARPVSAVALSPQFKSDRTYLSGGLAGQLILTIGGATGRTVDANTNSAAAAATGWMSSIGLAKDTGKDQILHQGEGKIGEIKWSTSGKWVCWVNEEGIKIMRSHLKLGEQTEDAWKRIAHASKPNRKDWVDMAGVWKARVQWVDDKTLEDDQIDELNGVNGNGTATSVLKEKKRRVEKLVVGWGDTAWVLHVQQGTSSDTGQKRVGSADIINKLQFRDCVVSGITMFSPSMLAILAYRTRDDDDRPIQQVSREGGSKKGRSHRHTGLAPQLRLIEIAGGEEIDLDELSVSRFETLSAQDYHLGTSYIPAPQLTKAEREQRGNLEAMWELSGGAYATKLFSSSASVLSKNSSGNNETGRAGSFSSPAASGVGAKGGLDVTPTPERTRPAVEAHPFATEPGKKLIIHSPYDCVLALKRDLSDHLGWMLEHERYAVAWNLLDMHPEVADASTMDQLSLISATSLPMPPTSKNTLADFFADGSNSSDTTLGKHSKAQVSAAQQDKRRIGDLWLQQLVNASQWQEAGEVAGKVLGTSAQWEHWVWTFAQAGRFDEITPFIPSTDQKPPLPSLVYELVLGYYIGANKIRLKQLLDAWDPEFYDVKSVISAIESQFESGEITEDSVQDGVKGRDWRILTDSLATLYLADGRAGDALRCYIRCQNADAAMTLIREEKMLGAVAEDVPGFVTLRVGENEMNGSMEELEEGCSEAINLLVEEALRGTVSTSTVVRQLEAKGPTYQPFIFFYLRTLWNGTPEDRAKPKRLSKWERRVDAGHAFVEDHADLALELFAEYDRNMLMIFIREGTVYSYDRAIGICERYNYIPELVYVLSKTGQTKRALYLIIDQLQDVKQAIEFCRDNGPDLWEELLDYSMDKPAFIRGLLEEVGTAIVDPIELVRRIPEGLEIEGLRDGVVKMISEYQIQHSISEGVAKVLRGEVQMAMDTLRAGQKKAVKFEVVHETAEEVDLAVKDPPTKVNGADGEVLPVAARKVETQKVTPGHCVGCGDVFHEEENAPLIGFACGHVYHLVCLLRANPNITDEVEKEDGIRNIMQQLGYHDNDAGEEEYHYSGRSVGGKVAHAHIIKNAVQGGCRHCVIPDGA